MLEAMQMEALGITSWTDFQSTPVSNLAYRQAIRAQQARTPPAPLIDPTAGRRR